MSNFEPNKCHLREPLIYFFNSKKSATETHRLPVETYGEEIKTYGLRIYWIKIRAKRKKNNTMDNTVNKT